MVGEVLEVFSVVVSVVLVEGSSSSTGAGPGFAAQETKAADKAVASAPPAMARRVVLGRPLLLTL